MKIIRLLLFLLLYPSLLSQTITVNSGYSLTLLQDYANPSLNINLNGGTLFLDGFDLYINRLTITKDSILDFGDGNSSFLVNSLQSNKDLNISNWTFGQDYFYVFNYIGIPPDSPTPKIIFAGFTESRWRSDLQVAPVIPEPASFFFLFSTFSILLFKRPTR